MEVKNKEFKEKQIGKNYAKVFLQALKSDPVNGLTIGQMRESGKLIDKIEAVKDDSSIELTKKEVQTLTVKTRAIKWIIYSPELVEMDDYLEQLIK